MTRFDVIIKSFKRKYKDSVIERNKKNKTTDIFYPLTCFPPRSDHGEPFSVIVIVYDKDSPEFFDLGYYDFENECWETFGSEKMDLKYWCFAPKLQKFLTEKYINTSKVQPFTDV